MAIVIIVDIPLQNDEVQTEVVGPFASMDNAEEWAACVQRLETATYGKHVAKFRIEETSGPMEFLNHMKEYCDMITAEQQKEEAEKQREKEEMEAAEAAKKKAPSRKPTKKTTKKSKKKGK